MIDCQEAVNQLWDYLENTLADANQAQMEEHLSFCRTCCGEVDFAEELRTVMGDASKPTIPDEVADRLNSYIDSLGGST